MLVWEVRIVMIEPSGDMRQLAAVHRQIYEAWLQSGFTEEQAMHMLTTMINAAFSSS